MCQYANVSREAQYCCEGGRPNLNTIVLVQKTNQTTTKAITQLTAEEMVHKPDLRINSSSPRESLQKVNTHIACLKLSISTLPTSRPEDLTAWRVTPITIVSSVQMDNLI